MGTTRKQLSTNTENKEKLAAACDVNETLANISLRWKMQILYCIDNGIVQFSKLKSEFPTLSDQVLGKRLKELKEEFLISPKNIPDTVPTQIYYEVSTKGKELLKLILDLHHWGQKWNAPGACSFRS